MLSLLRFCTILSKNVANHLNFFVDGNVNNLVYIILVKLVPAKLGTCGSEIIQRRAMGIRRKQFTSSLITAEAEGAIWAKKHVRRCKLRVPTSEAEDLQRDLH